MATPEQVRLSTIAFLIRAFAANPTRPTLEVAHKYMGGDKEVEGVIRVLEDLHSRIHLWNHCADPLHAAAQDRLEDSDVSPLECSTILALLFALETR